MSDERLATDRLWAKLDSLELADDERSVLHRAFEIADAAAANPEVSGFADIGGLRFLPGLPRSTVRPLVRDPDDCTSTKPTYTLSMDSETGDE